MCRIVCYYSVRKSEVAGRREGVPDVEELLPATVVERIARRFAFHYSCLRIIVQITIIVHL